LDCHLPLDLGGWDRRRVGVLQAICQAHRPHPSWTLTDGRGHVWCGLRLSPPFVQTPSNLLGVGGAVWSPACPPAPCGLQCQLPSRRPLVSLVRGVAWHTTNFVLCIKLWEVDCRTKCPKPTCQVTHDHFHGMVYEQKKRLWALEHLQELLKKYHPINRNWDVFKHFVPKK
jgi:hypothetical protein